MSVSSLLKTSRPLIESLSTHSLSHSVLGMYDDDLKKISSVEEEEVDDEDLQTLL